MERNFNVDRRFQIFCDKLTSNNVSKDLIIESSYNTIELSSNTIIFDGHVDLSMVTCNNINISNISEIVTKFLRVKTISLPSNVRISYNSVNDGYITNTRVGYNSEGIGRSDAYFTYINVSGGDSSFNNSLYINKNLVVDGTLTISNNLLINGANFASIETSFNNYKAALEQYFYSTKITTKDVSALNISISNELVVNKTAYINDLTISGQLLNSVLKVPNIFTIDPSGYDNHSGVLIINGDLTVRGAETTLSSSYVDIYDVAIKLASNLENRLDLSNSNAGLDISNIASLKYNGTTWDFSGGQLTVDNKKVLFSDDISLAKRNFDLSINALITDFSSSFFTIKRNIDDSYNDTYIRSQIDNSFILRSNVDLSLTALQSYANSSYISKNQLTTSFQDIITLIDMSCEPRNNKVIPGQPQYDYSTSTITPFGQDISGETTNTYSGYSVALSEDGTVMGITAPFNNGTGTLQGSARIYKYNDISWVQLGQDIDGETNNDLQTIIKLSKDGTIVALGSYFNSGTGSVRVFKYNNIDISWIQLGQDIDGTGPGDEFGRSISLSANGKIIAIGAAQNDTSYYNAGQVCVYSYNDVSWNKIGTFNGFDASSNTGRSVSLSNSGTILAISSSIRENYLYPTRVPRVDVYELSNNVWTPKGPTIYGPYPGGKGYMFGNNIVLSSDGAILAISDRFSPNDEDQSFTYGRALVYKYTSSDNSWNRLGSDISGRVTTSGSDDVDPYIALSADGTIMALGYVQDTDYKGLVRLYKFINNNWIRIGTTDLSGDNAQSRFGYSIALSSNGSILAIGMPINAPSFTGIITTYNVNYAYTLTYTNPTIIPNLFDSSFASFTEKLDISYVLKSIFEASHNSLKTRFDISFATINATNVEVSSIIIDTINTKHSSNQRFANTLWNQLGLDISNNVPLNNKKVAISNDGKVAAMSSSTFDLSNATDVGIVYVYELSYNEISYNEISYNWNQLGSNAILGISGDELGYSLALSSNGRIVAASSLYNDTSGNNCGQVRVYELSNNLWINRGNIINGRNITNYQSGHSLNLSGNGNLISISSLKGTTDLSYGEVRVYELSSNNIWIQKGRDISGTVIGAREGYSTSLSLDGTTLAIGCDVSINNIGQVKIFRFTNDWNSIGTIQGPQQYLTDISARSTIIQLGIMMGNGETPLEIAINFNGSIVAYPNDANTLILIFKYTEQEWTLVNNLWKYNFKGWLKLASPSLSGIQSIGYPNLSYDGIILSHAGRSNNINFIVVLRYNNVNLSWNEIYRITGPDSISALSGDGKVIAVTNSLSGNGYVSVYKYVSDLSWIQMGLNITGTASITAFATGIALSVSGDFIVCSTRNYLSNTGIARVYRYNSPVANNWNLIGDIVGPVAGKSFGWVKASMSSNGQTIAIGSYEYIYVYKYISDMSWLQIGAIQGNSDYYYFPSLSSDGTVVGLSKGGSRQTTGDIPYLGNKITQIWKYIQSRWIQICDKPSIGASNLLGFDLAGDGNSFVVATRYQGTYVYKYLDTTIVRRYSDLSFNTNKDKYLNLFFGKDVKLSSNGNRIVIGATGPIGPVFDDPTYNMNPSSVYRYNQGSIWAYEYIGTGTTWRQLGQSIHGISGDDEFGSSVSMSNDGTIISAGSNNNVTNSGYVRVYTFYNNYWYQVSNTLSGKPTTSRVGTHALSGDGTTLIQSNNTYNNVYGINKNLAFVPFATTINTTISGDLAVTGKAMLKSFRISDKHIFDVSINGYSSNYLASSDVSASIVDYYSNVGSIYNRVFKIDACGNVSNYSGLYGAISDSRLKENIVTTSPKLEDLLKIRVVNYNLKGQDTTKYIGVLAQELEELFPELVVETNMVERFKSVNYSSLTIMLIKAFQEQQVLINNLNATLEELEK